MILGVFPVATMCFILISAEHWLAGQRQKAGGLALLVAVLASILFGSLGAGVVFGAATLLGCLIGVLVERGWSYGFRLTAVTAVIFVGMVAFLAVAWDDMRHNTTIFLNARIAEFEAQPGVDARWMEVFRWYDVNFAYIGVGSMFASVLLSVAFLLSLTDRIQSGKDGGPRRITTGFQRMRLPDWLVWVAIAVALLWFAEQRWPNEALRFVTWNMAVALSAVYWLNGFSILLYAMAVLKASMPVVVLVLTGMVLLGLMHLLSMVGLFDTWYSFRVRFRRLALRRQLGYGSDDQEL